jgi:hypothetical protein
MGGYRSREPGRSNADVVDVPRHEWAFGKSWLKVPSRGTGRV